jgi:hypothetical protein
MMKQGTPLLRNYVDVCSMHAPNLDITYYLALVLFTVKSM